MLSGTIKINKILEKEMVIGYTVEGKPLTQEAYNKRLEPVHNLSYWLKMFLFCCFFVKK